MGNFQAPPGNSKNRFENPRTASTQLAPGSAVYGAQGSGEGGVALEHIGLSLSKTHRTRSQRGRPRNEKLKPSADDPPQATIPADTCSPTRELTATMGSSLNDWAGADAQGSARDAVPEDLAALSMSGVGSLLDKLALKNFESISNQIIHWANKSGDDADENRHAQVIKLVFEKAAHQSALSETYARLCHKMMESINANGREEGVQSDGEPNTSIIFQNQMLSRCQEMFDRGWGPTNVAVLTPTKKSAGVEGLGLLKFVGELFKLQILTEEVVHKCIGSLFPDNENPEEEEIQRLCTLLVNIGQALDTLGVRDMVDSYFHQMQDLIRNPAVTLRARFMLLDVIGLRRQKWIPRNATAAPQAVAQKHEVAAREKARAEKESMLRPGRGPMSHDGFRRDTYQRDGVDRTSAAGWSFSSGRNDTLTRPHPKSGDLSHFGKINRSGVAIGPSSVFSAKRDNRTGSTSSSVGASAPNSEPCAIQSDVGAKSAATSSPPL